jgi:hypothetical protein
MTPTLQQIKEKLNMATSPANLKESIRVQKTVTDLDTFEDVTLVNTADFAPIAGEHFVKDALERLGNDHAKLRDVINDGLRAEAMRDLREQKDGWKAEDEDGTLSDFTGTPADTKVVNQLVLTLAKTIFGYSKDLAAAAKKAAKESAMSMIKSNDAMKAGLKNSAAAK